MTQHGRLTRFRKMRARVTALLGFTLLGISLGCGDPTGSETYLENPDQLFWALELNHHAINLSTTAPYDTITLVGVAKNMHGDVLPDAPPVTFVSSSDRVVIFPNGVVRGMTQTSTSGDLVIATMTLHGVTRSDTARIVVTDVVSPPKMKTFSIQLVNGDSAVIAAAHLYDLRSKNLAFTALDSSGTKIPRVTAYYQSSAPSIGGFSKNNSGAFQGWQPGTTMVRVSATVYGVSMRDSLLMTVTNRVVNVMFVQKDLGVERETRTPVGGGVYWLNGTDDSLDIIFDDPDQVGKACCTAAALLVADTTGNIAPFIRDPGKPVVPPGSFIAFPRFEPDIVRGRSFLKAGRYKYHSTRNPNVWGTIIVE